MPTDVQFSRSEDVLATADMDGRVKMYVSCRFFIAKSEFDQVC